MGGCASAQRKSSSGSSSRKLRPSVVHSEVVKHSNSMPSESEMVKPKNAVFEVADQPISSSHGYTSRVSPLNSVSRLSNCGSKEEEFFDCQGRPESDCDEEFYSVNGDFTPSRGSTPLYRSIPGTPLNKNLSYQVNRALFEGRSPPYYPAETNRSSRGCSPLHRNVSAAAASLIDCDMVSPPNEPKKKRKKLGELFRESIREREETQEPGKSDADNFSTQPQNKEKHTRCWLPRLHSARFLKKKLAPSLIVV